MIDHCKQASALVRYRYLLTYAGGAVGLCSSPLTLSIVPYIIMEPHVITWYLRSTQEPTDEVPPSWTGPPGTGPPPTFLVWWCCCFFAWLLFFGCRGMFLSPRPVSSYRYLIPFSVIPGSWTSDHARFIPRRTYGCIACNYGAGICAKTRTHRMWNIAPNRTVREANKSADDAWGRGWLGCSLMCF